MTTVTAKAAFACSQYPFMVFVLEILQLCVIYHGTFDGWAESL